MQVFYACLIVTAICFAAWFIKWTWHYNDSRIIRRDSEGLRDQNLVVHVGFGLRNTVNLGSQNTPVDIYGTEDGYKTIPSILTNTCQ